MNKELNIKIKVEVPEGYEIDSENSTFENVIFIKSNEVNTWNDLNTVSGVYIGVDSDIRPVNEELISEKNINIFKDYSEAKSALAMAQISQLIPYYGGKVTDEDWDNEYMTKYIICRWGNKIIKSTSYINYYFLAFYSEEDRDRFLRNNTQLIKDYLMI